MSKKKRTFHCKASYPGGASPTVKLESEGQGPGMDFFGSPFPAFASFSLFNCCICGLGTAIHDRAKHREAILFRPSHRIIKAVATMGMRLKGAFICLFELPALGGKMSVSERKRVRHFSETSRWSVNLRTVKRNMNRCLSQTISPLLSYTAPLLCPGASNGMRASFPLQIAERQFQIAGRQLLLARRHFLLAGRLLQIVVRLFQIAKRPLLFIERQLLLVERQFQIMVRLLLFAERLFLFMQRLLLLMMRQLLPARRLLQII